MCAQCDRRARAVAGDRRSILNLGAPNLPGQPYVDPGKKPIELASQGELVAMVEARLREHPEDGQRLGRRSRRSTMNDGAICRVRRRLWAGHQAARRNAGAAEGPRRSDHPRQQWARHRAGAQGVRAHSGAVAGERRSAVRVGAAKEQDGKLAEAADDYKKILDAAPANARWKPALEVRLARLMRGGGTPTPESAEAAGMNKEQRDKFILGMVERLAARSRPRATIFRAGSSSSDRTRCWAGRRMQRRRSARRGGSSRATPRRWVISMRLPRVSGWARELHITRNG